MPMGKIKFLVFKDGATYDMSELVGKVTWGGRKGSAARYVTVTLLDDDGWKHARSGIDVTRGNQCAFYWEGKELFRGILMQQKQSEKKTMSVKAYDNGIYLANNKDTFNYTNKKASEIFVDICNRFQLPYTTVADTGYVIPELPKPKTTALDAILDALSLTFKATGIRYYVMSSGGKLSLIRRRENLLQWVIETGVNLESYDYSVSIEKIKTRIKLLSKEDTVVAEAANAELEKLIGVFQDIDKPDDNMEQANITDMVKAMLDEQSLPDKSLSISALGLPDVISGIGVFVTIKELGISKSFYIDEDTHTFEGNHHMMKLKLNLATDTDKPLGKSTVSSGGGDFKVGDVVQFLGGPHYIASTASSPTNSPKAGPAKITIIAKGAPHPYHVIHTDSQSTVYGWVDGSNLSK
jgi:phage-like element PBSX protein xkdQ|nr:MAG TPA: 43 kDa tail protein [Caudoviricetes sp.]